MDEAWCPQRGHQPGRAGRAAAFGVAGHRRPCRQRGCRQWAVSVITVQWQRPRGWTPGVWALGPLPCRGAQRALGRVVAGAELCFLGVSWVQVMSTHGWGPEGKELPVACVTRGTTLHPLLWYLKQS